MREYEHIFYSAETLAQRLGGRRAGRNTWRAKCPAHQGDNPTSLSITTRRTDDGYPITLLHCHAHDCRLEDICAALDIPLSGLWAVPPAKMTRRPLPSYSSPRLHAFALRETPGDADEIATLLLEEMIVSDPEWMATCREARTVLWQLSRDHERRMGFEQALIDAKLDPLVFWRTLAAEQGDVHE